MKRRLSWGALVATMTLVSASAVYAGIKLPYSLGISRDGNHIYFSGAIGSIRNDASNDYIGCYAGAVAANGADPAGFAPVVWCSAANATDGAVCVSSDPAILKVVQTIGPDSYVSLVVHQNLSDGNDPLNGTCESIEVQNYSLFAPKAP